MVRQPRSDTTPELCLRRALAALGLRYRVGVRPEPALRRHADVVFRRARVAVFVDGCFWHGCPRHFRGARCNAGWWKAKIAANRARDRATTTALRRQGWIVLRMWEHRDPGAFARRVATVVAERAGR